MDIENVPEESSLGWVEILNPLATSFEPPSFRFGGFWGFQIRLDRRRLSAKILNRYCLIEEAKILAETGQALKAKAKKHLREDLRGQLLPKVLLDTDLFEVLWFKKENEIWIAGAGEKKRLIFEELFDRTFGLRIRLIAPISLAFELIPKELGSALLKSQPSSFMIGEDG